MKTDIQIARETKPEHIRLVAEKLGIMEEELEYYGKYKAKLSDELWERVKDNKDGKEKTVAMEVLFRVVSGQIQGKETLLSFNFY